MRSKLLRFISYTATPVACALIISACDSDSPSRPPMFTPSNVIIAINHDSAATRDTDLRVYLHAGNCQRMIIGTDSTFADVSWEDYDTSYAESAPKIISVPHEEGPVWVYGRFATAGGGTTKVFSDDIKLDFTAAIKSLYVNARDDTLRPGDDVEFVLNAGEEGKAYVSFTSIRINYPLEAMGDGTFRETLCIPQGVSEDEVLTIGYFTDVVGNVADSVIAGQRFVIDGTALNPQEISHYILAGVQGNSIWYKSGYCFVCDTHSVHIVDVIVPSSPYWVREIPTGLWSKEMKGDATRLFIPYLSGLTVMQIQPPDEALVVGTAVLNEIARDVDVDTELQFVFVAFYSYGLVVFNVHERQRPTLVSHLTLGGYGEHICLNESTVYIVGAESGTVIDVQDPEHPEQLSTFTFTGQPQDLLFYGGYLFIPTEIYGIYVVDVHDPYNPVVVAEHPDLTPAYSLAVSSPFMYIGSDEDIIVVNVTRPSELSEITRVEGVGAVYGLFITEDYLYASGPSILSIIALY